MELTYFLNGRKNTIKLNESYQDDILEVTVIKQDHHYQMTVTPKVPLKIESARAFLHYDYHKNDFILANGYQSWTPTKEYPVNGKIRGLGHLPKSVIDKYSLNSYGDYSFYHYQNKAGIIHSYSYSYIRQASNFTLFGSLDESIGYTIFEHNTRINQISIIKDLSGLEIEQETVLLDMIVEAGEEIIIDDYFKRIISRKSQLDSLFGYSTGYYYSNNIDEKIINANIAAIDENALPFGAFVIDEGHQKNIGDWLETNREKFPRGLKPVVEKIHHQNMQAGIYLAPFVASGSSELYANHPDWFVAEVKSGIEWGGHYPLNLDLKEVKEYLKSVFDYYLDLGFDIFKLDFAYAPGLKTSGKTRAMMMDQALGFVRECIQDKILIVAQVPLFSALGHADIIQISCNIGKDYDNTEISRLLQRERISTKNSVSGSIYRRHLSKSGLAGYSDVAVLNDLTRLSASQKDAVILTNSVFNSVVFVSEDLNLVVPEMVKELHRQFVKTYKQVKVITHKSHAIIKYVGDSNCHIVDIDLNTGVVK